MRSARNSDKVPVYTLGTIILFIIEMRDTLNDGVESVALKAKILSLILLCLLISLPACHCQTIKLYKLYIGPWGVPPSEYINLDSQGSIEENLRQDLRSIVDALIHLGSLIISPENANVYE